ncbi:hypothetical protein ALC62_05751 [Cyphomyrmex costatus]|uniref:Uncharacterized protein n=1 Tax=Cyphomyrmex costatus TaxID=456900 RepID=A0A195CT95_9HYME|nr:hypothetical protein ALC62_05751 [Cyphomyrmex costatus]
MGSSPSLSSWQTGSHGAGRCGCVFSSLILFPASLAPALAAFLFHPSLFHSLFAVSMCLSTQHRRWQRPAQLHNLFSVTYSLMDFQNTFRQSDESNSALYLMKYLFPQEETYPLARMDNSQTCEYNHVIRASKSNEGRARDLICR